MIKVGQLEKLAPSLQLISNNYEEEKKVITSLEEELKICDAFFSIRSVNSRIQLKV